MTRLGFGGPPGYILGALTTELYGPEYRVLVSDSYQLCDRLLIQHIAQWLEHPVYNWEILGSNPSLVIFLCGPTLSPLGHVSPLGHFPIGLLRSHKFNSMVLAMPRNA